MKNQYYITLFFLVLLVILAACGGSTTTAESEQNSADSTQTQAATPTEAPAGDAEAGKEIFTSTCSACHGPVGEGVPGLGKDMTASEFISGQSDEELVEFVKIGRDPSDPLNTTGVAMPPKGGNPALSDEDLLNVVSFMRSLQK